MGTLSQKEIQQKATEQLLSAEAIAHMLAVADPSIEQLDAFAVHAGTCGRLMAEHLSAAAEHLGNLTVD